MVPSVDTAVAIFKTSEVHCSRARGFLKARTRGLFGEWKDGKEKVSQRERYP